MLTIDGFSLQGGGPGPSPVLGARFLIDQLRDAVRPGADGRRLADRPRPGDHRAAGHDRKHGDAMKGWKMRKFAEDVVYDLRSRGLLPVAIALAAAMVLVPAYFALTGSGGDSAADTVQPVDLAEPPPRTVNAVLAYDPGIRDYKERLDDLQSKDPFKQQFTAPVGGASSLDQTVDTSAAASGGSIRRGDHDHDRRRRPRAAGLTRAVARSGRRRSPATTSTRPTWWSATSARRCRCAGASIRSAFLPSPQAPVLVFLGTQNSREEGDLHGRQGRHPAGRRRRLLPDA